MSERFLPWRAYTALLRTALAGSMYAAGVAVWILRPDLHPVPTPVTFSAVSACLLIQAAAMLFNRAYWRRRPVAAGAGSAQRRSLVTRIMFVAAAALIVAVLVLIARTPGSPAGPPGDPDIAHGQYVMNNHGSLTPVPRETYLRAVEQTQTLTALLAVGFSFVGALVVWMTGDRLAARENTFAARPGAAAEQPDVVHHLPAAGAAGVLGDPLGTAADGGEPAAREAPENS